MKLQQYLLNDYLHTPYEEFSAKAVTAKGILISIQHNPLSELGPEQKSALEKSITRMEEIIRVVRDDVQVSLFVLDRNVTPQDHLKSTTILKFTFARLKPVKNEQNITLDTNQIQGLLYNAIMEIHDILMKEIAGFSEQMFYEQGSNL